jgi:RimJ/RimL family protein N-acetyltransferase
VFDRQDEIATWLGVRLGEEFSKPYTTIALQRDGKIVAAWLFNHYTGRNVEVSVAADEPITKGFIYAATEYVFRQLNCTRASCHVSTNNLKSHRFVTWFGWEPEGIRKQWYQDNSDALSFGMLKEKCKWLAPPGK